MDVDGYVRVSTEEQARGGVSIEVQTAKVRMYCELHGLTLREIIADEGRSGKDLDRPGLRRALERLRSGESEGVVVAKLDRLSRSVADWNALIVEFFGERAGRQLFSIGDSIDTRTAAGRLVLNVLMSVAQWERETIAERVYDAMQYVKKIGNRAGQIPYGRRLANPGDPDDTRLEDVPEEVATVALMLELRRGGWSLGRIARHLTERGAPTKSGATTWSKSSVHAILRRCERAIAS